MSKYLEFSKILYQRTPRTYLKEILMGLAFSIGISVLVYLFPTLTFVIVLGYFCLYQGTCMFENDIFLEKRDFDLFCIDKRAEYNVFYILGRMISDTFITNTILFTSVTIVLFVMGQNTQAVFWIVSWLVNFWLAPFSSLFGAKATKEVAIFYTAVGVIGYLVAIGFCIGNSAPVRSFFSAQSYQSSLILLAIFVGLALFFYIMSKQAYRAKRENPVVRFLFNLLRKIDIMMYKDYRLLSLDIFSSWIASMIMAVLLCRDMDGGLKSAYFLLGMCSDWVAAKRKKQYVITTDDTIFSENVFPEDAEFIRKKKRNTVFSVLPLKFVTGVVLSLFMDVFSLHFLCYYIMILLASAYLEFVKIYRPGFRTAIMNQVIKLTMFMFAGVSLAANRYYAMGYTFVAIVWITYWWMTERLCKYKLPYQDMSLKKENT